MTAVPKPLKFLRPFYSELISTCETWDEEKLANEKVSASSSSPRIDLALNVYLLLLIH
jgi:hypothetical protein